MSIGDYSRELCGGAHAPTTGEIGLFKIVEEASVAAGMRRIEALTGEAALAYVQETEALFGDVLHALSAARRDVPAQVEKLKDQVRDKDHELKALRRKLIGRIGRPAEGDVRTVRGIQVLVQRTGRPSPSEARGLADALKRKLGSGIVVLGSIAEDKAVLVVGVTKRPDRPRSRPPRSSSAWPRSSAAGEAAVRISPRPADPKTEALDEALRQSRPSSKNPRESPLKGGLSPEVASTAIDGDAESISGR